jgi:hypothetical protein
MPRGRPKGSKNKPKVATSVVPVSTVATNVGDKPMVGVTPIQKKERKDSLPINPEWVLTKTANGTPIAIVCIARCPNTVHFMVIPNYKERNSQITVDSKDVVKPVFDNPAIEKEFEGITWYTPPVAEQPSTDNIEENSAVANPVVQGQVPEVADSFSRAVDPSFFEKDK